MDAILAGIAAQCRHFDFIYIEDQPYEAVLADLRGWWPKVKPGGLFAGDDYALDDQWWGDGVTRVVNEFEHDLGVAVDHEQFMIKKAG